MKYELPVCRALIRCAIPAVLLLVAPAGAWANETGEVGAHHLWTAGTMPPLDDPAGRARAGKLCFPNGKLRISDFVRSRQAFRQMINDENGKWNVPSAQQTATTGPIEISLISINASLCAKNWGAFGMGDRKSLSGRVAFSFSLANSASKSEEQPVTRQIDLQVHEKGGRATEDLFSDALAKMIAGERAAGK